MDIGGLTLVVHHLDNGQRVVDAESMDRFMRWMETGEAEMPPPDVEITAQGTEAQRAETAQTGSVHDGPVAESDAPKGGNRG